MKCERCENDMKFGRCGKITLNPLPGDELKRFLEFTAIPIAKKLKGLTRVYLNFNGTE